MNLDLDGIRKLPKLTDEARAKLAAAGLRTRRALAERVAQVGLSATAGETGVDRGCLRDALAHYSLDEAEGRTRPLPLRLLAQLVLNWRELVLLGLLAGAVLGLDRARGRPEREVVAVRDLAPFQVIGEKDVRVRRTEAAFGTFASPGEVTGRFPLQVVAQGKPLLRERVSGVRFTRPADLEGRSVLSLPVTPNSATLAVPRSRVLLLVSPTEGGADAPFAVLRDVIVLDSRVAGDTSSVVVAVSAADSAVLAPLLGRSRVTVAQQAVFQAR
jgi:hypothetical protein